MENLLVTRTNCNSFIFTYSDSYTDLLVDIYEISLVDNWNGNFIGLPLYTTFIIPHIELPSVVPIVTSLSLPSDKIYVFKYTKSGITPSIIWNVPTRDELELIRTNLYLEGLGNFSNHFDYFSSSEVLDGNNLKCYVLNLSSGVWTEEYKTRYLGETDPYIYMHYIRGIRDFISIGDTPLYEVGDITSTGYIFQVINNNNGSFTYYECRLTDGLPNSRWWEHNGTIPLNLNVGTSTEFGEGKNNQELIHNYCIANDTTSLIDLISTLNVNGTEFTITEYSLYTIFCDLIQCRLNIIKRVLGELDNCKEECDCINVYDFNAFNAIYESILNLYEDLFSILNINVTNSIISASELDKLTTLDILLQQYKKYCIECKTPCKNC